MRRTIHLAIVAVLVASLAVVAVGTLPASATRSVRGFDGSTITVATLGIAQLLPGAGPGAEARIKRFNDNNEIKGIKIKYAGYVNDMQDPATSLSEARRLVTQVGVFALVGETSTTDPGAYFEQQQVPYFGGGFNSTFCSPKPDPSIWGFGTYGCTSPTNPPYTGDREAVVYKYAKQKLGKQHPTAALIIDDSATGRNSLVLGKTQFQGAGFKVVYAQANLPLEVPDYTPYVQAMLTSDNGHAPDVIRCYSAPKCVPMWGLVKASGFKGIFEHDLYTDSLVKPLQGTITQATTHNFADNTPALAKMKADVDAVAPGTKIDIGVAVGYLSTDMFIQALETVAKKGKSNITPANVRKAAAHQTWEVKGVAGPVTYPQSTVSPYPLCTALLADNDGTAWQTVTPYACTTKTLKIKH